MTQTGRTTNVSSQQTVLTSIPYDILRSDAEISCQLMDALHRRSGK